MIRFRALSDLDVKGKTVLVRADLNVPIKSGKVTDATRIERSAQTIRELVEKGAKVVVLSHFGRPEGKRVPEMSLRPVVEPLSRALDGVKVGFADDCVGSVAEIAVSGLPVGDVLVLENLRFHEGEEKNDPAFARSLAKLGDIYVNDAFSAAHRAHASTEALAHLLPSGAGRLMQAELEALGSALESPRRPVMGIVGGAKVSTKLDVLMHLVDKMDKLVIGGAMANTFLAAQGHKVGRSLHEADMTDLAQDIADKARQSGCDLILPVDAVVAAALEQGAPSQTVPITEVPGEMMILDLGPETVSLIARHLADARTVLWNGPLGAFETAPFDAATVAVARKVAEFTAEGRLVSVAGGGDTVAALAHANVEDRLTYVSTAGGAFLEWLEGKPLPGVAALRV